MGFQFLKLKIFLSLFYNVQVTQDCMVLIKPFLVSSKAPSLVSSSGILLFKYLLSCKLLAPISLVGILGVFFQDGQFQNEWQIEIVVLSIRFTLHAVSCVYCIVSIILLIIEGCSMLKQTIWPSNHTSHPSIRDGVLCSGMLLYLHLILK